MFIMGFVILVLSHNGRYIKWQKNFSTASVVEIRKREKLFSISLIVFGLLNLFNIWLKIS